MKLINALGKAIAFAIVLVVIATIGFGALFLVASGLMAIGLIEPAAVALSLAICCIIVLTAMFMLEDRR